MTWKILLLWIPILLAGSVGCKSVGVRPKFERYLLDMEFETDQRDDDDFDQRHTRKGIEVVFRSHGGPESFIDLSTLAIEDKEDHRLDAEGYCLGGGIKSRPPQKQGWGYDYGARLGYYNIPFDRGKGTLDPDWKYRGYEFDMNMGASHAFSLGESMLFSLNGGVFFKAMSEDVRVGVKQFLLGLLSMLGFETRVEIHDNRHGFDVDSRHSDYTMETIGLYLGTRLNMVDANTFDISGAALLGTSGFKGFMLSAGIQF